MTDRQAGEHPVAKREHSATRGVSTWLRLSRIELTVREQVLVVLVLATLLTGGIVQQCRNTARIAHASSQGLPPTDERAAAPETQPEYAEDRIQ